jgi:hypothetical protein
MPSQAEVGSLPRPGVAGDAAKLLEIFNSLAAKQADKVEVDEALLKKFASGAPWVRRGCGILYAASICCCSPGIGCVAAAAAAAAVHYMA